MNHESFAIHSPDSVGGESTDSIGGCGLGTAPQLKTPRKSLEQLVEECSFEPDAVLNPVATQRQKITMLMAVTLPFIGVILAVALTWQIGWVDWPYLGMLVIGWIATSLGITIGFHRLMAHRSFETHPWVRAFWMCLGALSIEGEPLIWCAVHRRHHSCSDQDGDPHSPHLHEGGWLNVLQGFWYSQVGWLFAGYWSHAELKKYVPDLLKDPMLVFLNRHYYVFVVLSLGVPALIGYAIDGGFGALQGLLWGGLVRIFLTHHITWSINSICHIFGRRDFQSNDHSTNNAICGILAMGEGWHNNHHAFPSSARHGLKWWQFDLSWIVIRGMQTAGLAWNVKLPTARQISRKCLRQREILKPTQGAAPSPGMPDTER